MIIIPFIEFPAFTEDMIIENTSYKFAFIWNDRGEYWTFTIANSDGDILISGIKIVIDYELITNFPGRDLMPGSFVAVDPSNTVIKIGRDDFQDEKVSLVYTTKLELEQIESGELTDVVI